MQHHAACLVFGDYKQGGFLIESVWFDEPGLAQGLDKVEYLDPNQNKGQMMSDLQDIFNRYRGLEGFTRNLITGYVQKGCKYTYKEKILDAQKNVRDVEYRMECTNQ
ncbi:hypothetical protein MHLP_00345 [Candidatus Mycoplasma haematolamae str. Purdue]|uniref:Uncharacterized protein n=1 Tax=Mycoplasma haematolamae (strain Purdue) TaxID=1212765 RepID=I7CIG7_MYCHA|nr:hypothetical protein [Candidatus Mycoplasma haematolamae]AFO51649.1 hypothetical protein MHLP_00345 [Candidatus Mycoplasma haematolamae str. Purdue]